MKATKKYYVLVLNGHPMMGADILNKKLTGVTTDPGYYVDCEEISSYRVRKFAKKHGCTMPV